MLTRRDHLRLLPSSALFPATSREAAEAGFVRVDTHVHIHQDAPELVAALGESGWRGLDIVICPAVGDEPFDLEAKLEATRRVAQRSGGVVAS
ncbi:hypothetical protein [Tautonia plasticadhaerens]|uniref:Uncharacterized protein n=1 Tax=Tautonia plasticadhaerens TaxID=2527974 RepID=A0A518H820_9BACT|nr:hypothetical protein [Tautonia plasticadhaerens]QDV37000.1 hypothetical protein ElP_49320 [Tautonia plasticadhaerens]